MAASEKFIEEFPEEVRVALKESLKKCAHETCKIDGKLSLYIIQYLQFPLYFGIPES